mgnify:FL=1
MKKTSEAAVRFRRFYLPSIYVLFFHKAFESVFHAHARLLEALAVMVSARYEQALRAYRLCNIAVVQKVADNNGL